MHPLQTKYTPTCSNHYFITAVADGRGEQIMSKGYYGKANDQFNFGSGASCPSRMRSLLAESYYYPSPS